MVRCGKLLLQSIGVKSHRQVSVQNVITGSFLAQSQQRCYQLPLRTPLQMSL